MNTVKVIFIFILLQVARQACAWILLEQTLPLDDDQEQCIKELKLDRATMARLSAQQFPPEDNSDYSDFHACSWKKQGYMHQNGGINFDALEKMIANALKDQAGSSSSAIRLSKQMAATAVNDCTDVEGKSPGQVAVKIQNCLYRRMMQFSEE